MVVLEKPLKPGSTIGILGSGQLGRMAALAAANLGYRCHIYGPEEDAPANQVTSRATVAAYDDLAALGAFADAVDLVTFEFENVPPQSAAFLAERRPVHPSPQILAICRNRLKEKDFCHEQGISTARYAEVSGPAALTRLVRDFGRPAILKSCELGYDGKGQVVLDGNITPIEAWQRMAGHNPDSLGVLEAFVEFKCEISVVVARSLKGQIQTYPAVENQHRNQILDQTIVPARVSPAVAERAEAIGRRLAEALGLVGLLAVEMFVTQDDEVLVNELAPRPHNSGHWTMDGCVTSQFEQFIRAVAGLPLGSVQRHGKAVMRNLLGDDVALWPKILAEPGAKLHLYGKAEARPGRKMGHVTRLIQED